MFKLSLRTLVHYRLYSIINLLGLGLSLTCVVIIARYIHSELTVDAFNTKLDRIYITTAENSNKQGEVVYSGIFNPNREKNFVDISGHPGVEKHSSFRLLENEDIVAGDRKYSTQLLVSDTVLLQILDYPVTAGANNIRRPEDVLVTETFAAKIFGKENPVGKTLSYPVARKTLTVAGVIRTPANRSVLSFDMLASSELGEWHRMPQSLILLYPNVDYRDINRQYAGFMEMTVWGYGIRYQLSPYKDVYLNKNISDYGQYPHGDRTYIFILTAIGVLLLLTGLLNYINIHSVVMIRRNREFGMKKVFGADGGVIFAQLLLENLLLIAGSLILALWFASALSPFVENTLGIRQYPNLKFDVWLAVAVVAVLPVAVSVAPYLRYRYFSPVRSLRAVNAGYRSLFARKFFLCFQYFITMTLIAVSLFFVRQLNFMLDKDLGFRTQNIIKVPFLKESHAGFYMSWEDAGSKRAKDKETVSVLKQKINSSSLIECWSFGEFPFNEKSFYRFTVDGKEIEARLFGVDETWFKLFGVRLRDGRLWDNGIDEFTSYSLIVTGNVLKQFNITDWHDAGLQPHQRIWWSYIKGREKEMETNPPYRVVGVVNDFYTAHLSRQLDPVAFYFSEADEDDPVIASFAPERRQEVVEFMKNLHGELVGGEFTYSFIEDEIAALYREDRKVAIICTVFTGIAILISMLGLLGISLFDIRRRRKEIAIRKVNGAQITDILRLLLKKYFILLGFAFVVATPAALFVIHKYLENFAHKAPVSWWLFAAALTVTVAVSLCTLLWQAYKAGNENPANVIKEV